MLMEKFWSYLCTSFSQPLWLPSSSSSCRSWHLPGMQGTHTQTAARGWWEVMGDDQYATHSEVSWLSALLHICGNTLSWADGWCCCVRQYFVFLPALIWNGLFLSRLGIELKALSLTHFCLISSVLHVLSLMERYRESSPSSVKQRPGLSFGR